MEIPSMTNQMLLNFIIDMHGVQNLKFLKHLVSTELQQKNVLAPYGRSDCRLSGCDTPCCSRHVLAFHGNLLPPYSGSLTQTTPHRRPLLFFGAKGKGPGGGGGGGLVSNEDISRLLQKVHCHIQWIQTLRGTAYLTTFFLIL
jgi:hypothetical protein